MLVIWVSGLAVSERLDKGIRKGGGKKSNVCDTSWKPKVSLSVTVSHCFLVFYTVSWYFTLFPCVSHCFLTFLVLKCRESRTFYRAEVVVNHTLFSDKPFPRYRPMQLAKKTIRKNVTF